SATRAAPSRPASACPRPRARPARAAAPAPPPLRPAPRRSGGAAPSRRRWSGSPRRAPDSPRRSCRRHLARAFERERIGALAIRVAGIVEPGHQEAAAQPLPALEGKLVVVERAGERAGPDPRLGRRGGEDAARRDRDRTHAGAGEQLAPAAAL